MGHDRKAPTISREAQEWIDRWMTHLEEKEDLSPKTRREFASDLRDVAHWFEQTWNEGKEVFQFDPRQLTTKTIIEYRGHCQTVRGHRPETINRRLITIKRFLDWCVQEEVVEENEAQPVKLVPEVKASPRQLSDRQEADLVAAVKHHGDLRDRTIILLMLHTGLRLAEVCNLRRKHIHLFQRSGYLEVVGGKRNKYREVPLNITIREALKEYLDRFQGEPDDFLFRSKKTGGQMSTRALGHLVEKYMKKAGLRPDPEGHMWTARDLRHRFGYVMAQKTPLHRLAQIMGHDSLDTTMIYIRATREDLQKEVEKIAWR